MSAQVSAQQVLGSYVVERELGRGGMGAVYLGVHQTLGKRAAIKVLLPELSKREDLVERFWAEARTVTAIAHASIVDVYDHGVTAEGHAYIVMEYLDGESLGARLQARGVLPIPQAIAIARQVAHALAAAHAVGVVHRDLKPDNIFLVPDPEVAHGERAKLLDFGVAKLIGGDGSHSKTMTGAILGTPQYMSPEQCEGARAVDHRSDLYSLGCTLFQMVAGRPPFESAGAGGLIGMHLHVPPPALRDRAPHASPALAAIVARLLAKDPAERFASGEELAAALADPAASEVDPAASAPLPQQRVDAAQPTAVSRVAPPPALRPEPAPTPVGAPARARWPWAVAALVVVAGAIVAIVAAGSGERAGTVAARGAEAMDAPVAVGVPIDADPGDDDDGEDGAGDELLGAGAVALANLRQAVAGESWLEAGAHGYELRALPADHPIRVEGEAALQRARPRAMPAFRRNISEAVGEGRCLTAVAFAEVFAIAFGDRRARDQQALRDCKPAEPPTHAPSIRAAHDRGEDPEVIDLCARQLPQDDATRALCVTTACSIPAHESLALVWIVTLARADAATAIRTCRDEHGASPTIIDPRA